MGRIAFDFAGIKWGDKLIKETDLQDLDPDILNDVIGDLAVIANTPIVMCCHNGTVRYFPELRI